MLLDVGSSFFACQHLLRKGDETENCETLFLKEAAHISRWWILRRKQETVTGTIAAERDYTLLFIKRIRRRVREAFKNIEIALRQPLPSVLEACATVDKRRYVYIYRHLYCGKERRPRKGRQEFEVRKQRVMVMQVEIEGNSPNGDWLPYWYSYSITIGSLWHSLQHRSVYSFRWGTAATRAINAS